MPTTLGTNAQEQSNYTVQCDFKDEADSAVVPLSVTWTLTDTMGNVINSRSDVSVTPASTIHVTLSGDDLALSETATTASRVLTVEATYTSTYPDGDGSYTLKIKDTAEFQIDNLEAV